MGSYTLTAYSLRSFLVMTPPLFLIVLIRSSAIQAFSFDSSSLPSIRP